jgi:hypothetical protein
MLQKISICTRYKISYKNLSVLKALCNYKKIRVLIDKLSY